MYRHLVTTIEGRVLHVCLETGVVRDGDGDVVNGETVAYLRDGKYQRMVVGEPQELCYQSLNRLVIPQV